MRALAKTAAEQAIAPAESLLRQLERRLDDLQGRLEQLERRPAPVIAAAPSPAPIAHVQTAPVVQHAPALAVVQAPAPARSVEFSPGLESELQNALDGRKRRIRLLVSMVVLVILGFGGLVFALVQSYAPTPH